MRKMIFVVLVLGLAVPGALTGCGERRMKAPNTGTVTQIVHDARACFDQTEKTVLVEYRPAGTDRIGDPWPLTMFCATPERAAKLVVGKTVTE